MLGRIPEISQGIPTCHGTRSVSSKRGDRVCRDFKADLMIWTVLGLRAIQSVYAVSPPRCTETRAMSQTLSDGHLAIYSRS